MKEYRVFTMYSETLKRDKRVFVYLPRGYDETDEFYPVLYMNDGHNLFDDKQATYGKSWGIMEAYENDPTLPQVIIVGIDNGDEHRADELLPYKITYPDGSSNGGSADNYLQFLTTKVKPMIDRKFRTFKSSKNTGLMGSSFGGVNTTYAACAYGTYFTRFGNVSNAYFYPGIYKELQTLVINSSLKTVKKFYIDCGTKETEDAEMRELYIEANKEMYEIMRDKIDESSLQFNLVEDATHSEKDWEKRFPNILKFLFTD